MSTADFLFEIGVEELPAAAAASALTQAVPLAIEAFAAHRITLEERAVSAWVSPRRIAIFAEAVPGVQEDEETVERGPAAAAAFDEEGRPTRAAEGFARAKGVPVADLQVREHQGREFVFAVHLSSGSPVPELLPDICRRILTGFLFPKTMRWDGSGFSFSRPVRWLVTKFGGRTIKFEAFGLTSGGSSRGHRFLSDGEAEIGSAGDYLDILESMSVMADQAERRRLITEGLAERAAAGGAVYSDPGGKLEEVLYLVEYPTVLAGSFGEEHLRLPDRVLITAMQSHQRYFPLIDKAGELLNGFLFVSNAGPEHSAAIIEGNERILEGRIEDAEFSFDKDLAKGIEAMNDGLTDVVYHRRLGTLADKTARLKRLVASLADELGIDEDAAGAAVTAAGLSKADLVSVMVQEFSDLEGYIGSVYARMEGYPGDVCEAIAEQYLPTSAGGELPRTIAGALLAIADKVDNIVGAWSVDEQPTGSRDPYGLRRAAVGIAAIAESFELDIDLLKLLSTGHQLYIEQKADVDRSAAIAGAMLDFAYDRMQGREVEQGMPVEVFEAARASGVGSPLRLLELARALDEFRADKLFENLHTAYFRCSKIAAKAGGDIPGEVDPSLFEHEAEGALLKQLEALEPRLEEAVERRDYAGALESASALREPVDRFFDDVLVMAEDERVRANRLALVSRVAALLLRLGNPILVAAAAGR